MLLGDMMFVQQSMVTNIAAIRWLKRHFEPKGIQVHTLHFPYDLFPSHMDCTFVRGTSFWNHNRAHVNQLWLIGDTSTEYRKEEYHQHEACRSYLLLFSVVKVK